MANILYCFLAKKAGGGWSSLYLLERSFGGVDGRGAPLFCLTRSSHSMSCGLSNRLKELWESFERLFLVPWAGTMYYLFTARVGGSCFELIAGTYTCIHVNYVHSLLV